MGRTNRTPLVFAEDFQNQTEERETSGVYKNKKERSCVEDCR